MEVLSPSSGGYDWGAKFTDYKSNPSFREYLVIVQSRTLVIRYFRQPNGFRVRHDYEAIASEVPFESLNITLQMSEIYERMNF